MMKRAIVLLAGVAVVCSAGGPARAVAVEGGLIVCVGADALESVAGHWQRPGCIIQCLETSDAAVRTLRSKVMAAGCHGKVSVARFDGEHLPYVDNLVNLIVCSASGARCSKAEMMRVLAPYGRAVVNGEVMTKPYPVDMDEWPQYLHGADNNCVAQDTVVGPPRHVQWTSGPAWTRGHIGAATISCMVSSGGRLFTIEDTETAENPLLPARWQLVARGAFNGIRLWALDYPEWEQITVYIKDYHAQMQRRLAAIGNTVYCTPGLKAPLTALDGVTGKRIREYAGTERTQEFVYHRGKLFVVLGDRMSFNAYKGAATKRRGKAKGRKGKAKPEPAAPAPAETPKMAFQGAGFPFSAYAPQTPNAESPTSVIAAFEAETGKELWRTGDIDRYVGCTMALKGDRLVYQSAHGVFCIDARTGAENWAARKEIPYGTGNRPNSLVLSSEAVYSEEGKGVHAYALADGSAYWDKPIPVRKGYQASSDLLIAAGALWMCGNCNNPKGLALKQPTAFNLKTGAEIRTIPQKLSKPMGHDRCFRNFITERFFINSKTGGPDCLDLASDAEYPAPFTRGTCSMGPLPCNGLIYCGPWACQCHLPVGLHNFNAYYTNEASLSTKGQVVKVTRSVRLEKGPAYGEPARVGDAPWPTYRQDARRYAGTPTSVPAAGLAPLWKTQPCAKTSAPVIADGKLFVAETDTHLLRALAVADGSVLWEYVAGGRIDSPPTYHQGLLLFGSRDGWVQCVRASDGALCWRFRDLPDKVICAFGQLESAWPVHGSVLISKGTAYFCAGRSSYLDGGLFIYGLDPVTGALRHSRQFYGPYAADGFPAFVEEGNRSETEVVLGTTADIMSCENETLYIRQQAFKLDLTDAEPELHLLASAGMLEPERHHREYKLVRRDFNHRKTWTSESTEYPTGDIIVSDGKDYYSVFGMPVTRGSVFNPRNGYLLTAKTRSGDAWSNKWKIRMPLTGKAMALAADTVFVVGAPLVFDSADLGATYAGRRGAVLWAVAAADGTRVAEYKLEALPVWDGMAAAYGKLFFVNQDGSIACWGATQRAE